MSGLELLLWFPFLLIMTEFLLPFGQAVILDTETSDQRFVSEDTDFSFLETAQAILKFGSTEIGLKFVVYVFVFGHWFLQPDQLIGPLSLTVIAGFNTLYLAQKKVEQFKSDR